VAGLRPDAGALPVGDDEVALLLAGADSGLRVHRDAAVAALLAAATAFLAERAVQASAAWRLKELANGARRVTEQVLSAVGGAWQAGETRPVAPRDRGPVGLLPQRDGRTAIGALVPLGRLTAPQARVLADAAGQIIVTPWRGVVVPDLAPADATGWAATFVEHGLVLDPESPWLGVTACAGLPGCAKSRADVRADAASAVSEKGLAVHWIGCERGCGRPAGRHVEVLATGDGYDVSVGDKKLAHNASGDETTAAVAIARRRA
jgi:precorrin-3B synthase